MPPGAGSPDPSMPAVSASELIQQHLREAVQPSDEPTDAPGSTALELGTLGAGNSTVSVGPTPGPTAIRGRGLMGYQGARIPRPKPAIVRFMMPRFEIYTTPSDDGPHVIDGVRPAYQQRDSPIRKRFLGLNWYCVLE